MAGLHVLPGQDIVCSGRCIDLFSLAMGSYYPIDIIDEYELFLISSGTCSLQSVIKTKANSLKRTRIQANPCR